MRTVLCGIAAAAVTLAASPAPIATSGGLQVEVIAGGGVSNSLRQATAHPVTVQVRDREGRPVPEATVTAVLPPSGAGAAFAWGSEISSKQTNSEGLATFSGMRLRPVEGEFPIRITAAANGASSTVTALQSVRAAAPASVTPSRWSRRRLVMLGVVSAGTAAAIIAATSGHGAAAPTGPSGTGAYTPGLPVTTGPR
ncbi:MAG TPA: hypothetical protein VFL57_02065 [Bryobacteraceae bacterium]|nr:hypothetical protein [Bryobacteraceae bacterium]